MNGKLKVAFTIAIALFTILLFSCKERDLLSPQNDKTIQTTQKDSTLNKPPCSVKYVSRWKTVKFSYIPADGKKLGFNKNKFASLREMKEQYGFSKVIGVDHTLAINAGFLDKDIVGSVNREMVSYPALYYSYTDGFDSYYLDEPLENEIEVFYIEMLSQILYPRKLILGSYKIGILDLARNIVPNYKDLTTKSNIYIMSDNYYGFYVDKPWKMTTNQDQRMYWDDFKKVYDSKNRANWISLIIDEKATRGHGDFYELLDWANNNGLKEMWLYIGNADSRHPERLTQTKFDKAIKKFVEVAYHQGWLKRKEVLKEYILKYVCSLPNPCKSCDQKNEFAAGWSFIRKWETGRKKIIIQRFK